MKDGFACAFSNALRATRILTSDSSAFEVSGAMAAKRHCSAEQTAAASCLTHSLHASQAIAAMHRSAALATLIFAVPDSSGGS